MRSFKWTIYRAELDPVIGSEIGKSRPVLVISENYVNQLLNAVNIIPITSRKTVEKYIGTRRLFHIRALALKMNPSYSVTKFEQLIRLDFRRFMVMYSILTSESRLWMPCVFSLVFFGEIEIG